jgi:hypothetical protein
VNSYSDFPLSDQSPFIGFSTDAHDDVVGWGAFSGRAIVAHGELSEPPAGDVDNALGSVNLPPETLGLDDLPELQAGIDTRLAPEKLARALTLAQRKNTRKARAYRRIRAAKVAHAKPASARVNHARARRSVVAHGGARAPSGDDGGGS